MIVHENDPHWPFGSSRVDHSYRTVALPRGSGISLARTRLAVLNPTAAAADDGSSSRGFNCSHRRSDRAHVRMNHRSALSRDGVISWTPIDRKSTRLNSSHLGI